MHSVLLFWKEIGGDHIENYQDIYGHDRIVVFGLNGCGDYIGFDYRPDVNNPKIVLMYHDQYIKDQHGNPRLKLIKVFDNYDNFFDFTKLA